ncbi:type II toxin-antitoxin system PemK/MazF family toxin [Candidatus Parcubacteria bacterium]|nr:type II toxin-antitoxin system PemK/MazF family toxin [Patescibacteria group bacterium]MCG2694137.1 type II toxin-antitoxin system PemK/MazF family toxin [Candidatus Parcubacteria bacterium]
MDADKEIAKNFIDWTRLKIKIHFKEKRELYFKEREIWWASLGQNIGYERDGKNENFERPVLMIKVFNGEVLWVLPITSKDKTGKFYVRTEYEREKYSIILSQLRLISSQRLLRKLRTIPEGEFRVVKEKIKRFLQKRSPDKVGGLGGRSHLYFNYNIKK